MLTAPPNESNQTSEIILLAVELAKENAQHPFVKYLNEILSEAKKILEDPENIPANRKPQAVKFAFYLHLHPELRKLLSDVETFKDISEDRVKEILNNMGKRGLH